MFWAVIIALFVLAALGAGIYGVVIGLGIKHVPEPPPVPTPFITSAVGTGSHTIHLTLQMGSGDWGTVELERYRTADQSAIIFPTSLNELDDTNLEPDIPPGNGVYRYRARYNIPQRPLGPWSPVVEARTLPLVEAFNKGELTIPEGTGWAGYCLVQRFEAGALSRSGSQISITLRASTAGLSIDRIYISQADPAVGMDPDDFLPNTLATMQDTLWKPPIVIPPSGQTKTFTVPAILYNLDHTKPLLMAVDFSATTASEIMYRELRPQEAVMYYKLREPLQPNEQPEARKTDRQNYNREPTDTTKGGVYLIEKIEVG